MPFLAKFSKAKDDHHDGYGDHEDDDKRSLLTETHRRSDYTDPPTDDSNSSGEEEPTGGVFWIPCVDLQQQLTEYETRAQRRRSLQENNTRVQFSTITIRSYPLVIGDNPSSPVGPPLSIAWQHESECTLEVREFENERPERRLGREMILPPSLRMDKLRAAGFTQSEIVHYTKQVNVTRAQRKRTEATLYQAFLQEILEDASRKTRNLLDLGKSKREERKFLEQFRFDSERLDL